VVLATNLYLLRYYTEPTGDKRIQLELVRLLCGIEALVLVPQNGLIQNRGLPAKWVSKPSDHSIPCLASRYATQIYANGSPGSNARIGWIGHLWGDVAEFSPTGRGSEGVRPRLDGSIQ
jgi:hypothetical protein